MGICRGSGVAGTFLGQYGPAKRVERTRTIMSVGHAMKPMSEAHFAILRRHMAEAIGIQVDLASEELGKTALDERVLAASARSRGTASCPPSSPLSLTRTRRCRSASIRRSRSPSSSRS